MSKRAKKDLLPLISRARLLELAGNYDVTGLSSKSKGDIVQAMVQYRKIALADMLETLKRDELKDLCKKLSLGESGREKAVLIERLVNGKQVASVAEAPAEYKADSKKSTKKKKINGERKNKSPQTMVFL
ncbi:SAP domain-containing protein [Sulfuriflexus sp.]|uniref:SAP domain-containing protein n=1 Tax=Sulfuriflexus sp. TaxID=2015443 RepID=UPI0028CD88FD|nr:SAP domain-containing protein [Sulfuriflexus sp.]MDT8405045.1 SAP domain-containing protein [Sulfuriflexus sp.]